MQTVPAGQGLTPPPTTTRRRRRRYRFTLDFPSSDIPNHVRCPPIVKVQSRHNSQLTSADSPQGLSLPIEPSQEQGLACRGCAVAELCPLRQAVYLDRRILQHRTISLREPKGLGREVMAAMRGEISGSEHLSAQQLRRRHPVSLQGFSRPSITIRQRNIPCKKCPKNERYCLQHLV